MPNACFDYIFKKFFFIFLRVTTEENDATWSFDQYFNWEFLHFQINIAKCNIAVYVKKQRNDVFR